MTATLSHAISEAARTVEQKFDCSHRKLRELATFGVSSHIEGELREAFADCREADWDGYDALPVSYDSYLMAEQFLLALPLGTPLPTVGAEPDGQLTLEWSRGIRRSLSISFDPAGDLHYAALIGPGGRSGTEPFVDAVPRVILDLIRQVS